MLELANSRANPFAYLHGRNEDELQLILTRFSTQVSNGTQNLRDITGSPEVGGKIPISIGNALWIATGIKAIKSEEN